MKRSLRARVFGAAVLIFVAGTSEVVFAGGPQKPAARLRSLALQAAAGDLSVSVVSLAAGASLIGPMKGSKALDMGTVSRAGSHSADVTVKPLKDCFIVTTTFGLLVQDSSQHTRFATVSAFVTGANSQLTYAVDGRKLSSSPTVILPQIAVGGVSKHRLDVEIPNSLTERNAQQQVAIQFEVMPN